MIRKGQVRRLDRSDAIGQEYDGAARLSKVKDASKTYSGSYAYHAHGGLKSESFGDGAEQSFTYNNRLQLVGGQNFNISFIAVADPDIDQSTNRFASTVDFTCDNAGYLKVDRKFRGLTVCTMLMVG